MTRFMLLGLLLTSLNAHAVQTNMTLTPESGQFDLRPSVQLGIESTTGNGVPDNRTGSAKLSGLFLYGVDSNNSFGLSVGYAAGRQEIAAVRDFDIAGVMPASLFYRANWEIGGTTLFYNLGYSFDLEKRETNRDTNTANFSKGQREIDVTIGIVLPVDIIKFGGFFSYTKALDGQRTIRRGGQSIDFDLSRGDTMGFTGLAELEYSWHPTLTVTYLKKYQRVEKSGSADFFDDGEKWLVANFFTRFDISSNMQIIPLIGLQNTLNTQTDAQNVTALNVSATFRLLF